MLEDAEKQPKEGKPGASKSKGKKLAIITHPDTKRQCNIGTTYTTSRTSWKRQMKQKFMQKTTFQDQLTTKDQSHSPPQQKFGSGMRTVQPAQLVVPVAKEYRSRV